MCLPLVARNRRAVFDFVVGPLACVAMFAVTAPALAGNPTFNVVGHWRLGEDDSQPSDPVVPSDPVKPLAVDHAGLHNLVRQGSQTTNTAHYSADVAPSAAAHTGSALSVLFSNSSINDTAYYQTPSDPVQPSDPIHPNFGLEAWVKTSTLTPVGHIPNIVPTDPIFPTDPVHEAAILYNGDPFQENGMAFFQADDRYVATVNGGTFVGSVAATTSDWVHLALVAEVAGGPAPKVTFYVNGFPQDPVFTTVGDLTGHFSIGDFAPGDVPFNGLIDEVRMFNFDGPFDAGDLLLNAEVPEPGSFSLGLLAAGTLAIYSRLRRRTPKP